MFICGIATAQHPGDFRLPGRTFQLDDPGGRPVVLHGLGYCKMPVCLYSHLCQMGNAQKLTLFPQSA